MSDVRESSCIVWMKYTYRRLIYEKKIICERARSVYRIICGVPAVKQSSKRRRVNCLNNKYSKLHYLIKSFFFFFEIDIAWIRHHLESINFEIDCPGNYEFGLEPKQVGTDPTITHCHAHGLAHGRVSRQVERHFRGSVCIVC